MYCERYVLEGAPDAKTLPVYFNPARDCHELILGPIRGTDRAYAGRNPAGGGAGQYSWQIRQDLPLTLSVE